MIRAPHAAWIPEWRLESLLTGLTATYRKVRPKRNTRLELRMRLATITERQKCRGVFSAASRRRKGWEL